jgi:hypothetical protein
VGLPAGGNVTVGESNSQYVRLSEVNARLDRLQPVNTCTVPNSVTGDGVGVPVGVGVAMGEIGARGV